MSGPARSLCITLAHAALGIALGTSGCSTEAPVPKPAVPSTMDGRSPRSSIRFDVGTMPPPRVDPVVVAQLRERLADPEAGGLPLRSPEATRFVYEHRQGHPAWISDRRITAKGVDALRGLGQLATHGLEPARYGTDALAPDGAEPEDPLAFELVLTDAWLTAAAHLGGRVDPQTMRATWTADGRAQALAQALEAALDEGKPREAMLALAPSHPAYVARVDALAGLLERAEHVAPPKGLRRLREQLAVDLERLRWLPRELGPRYLWLDLGAGQVTLFEGAEAGPTTRVAASKRCRDIDTHSATITRVTLGPADHDLGGYALRVSGDLDLVLHGAPEDRAFPSNGVAPAGCWRLEDPQALAKATLQGSAEFAQKPIDPPAEGPPQEFELDQPLPFYVTRTSVDIDAEGTPTLREGAYARDASLRAALAQGPEPLRDLPSPATKPK